MCGRNKVVSQDYVKLRIGFLPNGGKRVREKVHLSNGEVGQRWIDADARIMPDHLAAGPKRLRAAILCRYAQRYYTAKEACLTVAFAAASSAGSGVAGAEPVAEEQVVQREMSGAVFH
jgi:hypothetical protein